MYRVIYITVEGVSSTVFESQVRGIASCLISDGVSLRLIVLQPYKPLLRPEAFIKFIKEMATAGYEIYMKPRFSCVPEAKEHARNVASKLKPYPGIGPLIFHCRNAEAGLYGVEFAKVIGGNARVLLDVRGIVVAEMEQRKDLSMARYYSDIEHGVFYEVDGCSFVSPYMKRYYEARYDLSKKCLGINVAGYDEKLFYHDPIQREKLRNTMSWHNKIVFVYSGGTQIYQSLERIVEVFGEVKSKCPEAHLLLLLARPARKLKGWYSRYGIDSSHVTCFINKPYFDIPRYLNAADWGMLYRERDPINEVSTPTKIAEYLGCGLRVLYGGGAGYYGDLIKENPNLGVVVPFSENLASLKFPEISEKSRENIAGFALKNLSKSRNVDGYKHLYDELIKKH